MLVTSNSVMVPVMKWIASSPMTYPTAEIACTGRCRSLGWSASVAALCLFVGGVAPGLAAPLVFETFDVNPIASGRAQVIGNAARFTYEAGGLVAHYDSGQTTTEVLWPLGRTLNQNASFDVEAAFTIRSANFFAKANDFAQLSFGLLNSVTTGASRTGGNAFDFVGVDYFPSQGTVPSWNVPALGPTVIQSNIGTSFFGRIEFPFGAESGLKIEGALPLDVQLTASLHYDASQRILTLGMRTASGPHDINSSGDLGDVGGPDEDISTIQLFLPEDVVFSVDRLAIPLWNVPAVGGGSSALLADLLFDSLRVDLPSLVPGDANEDGLVDAGDYTIWANHFLATNQSFATGDFTGDGIVDAADYTVWANHFSPGLTVSAVPEPRSVALAAVGGLIVAGLFGRRRALGGRLAA